MDTKNTLTIVIEKGDDDEIWGSIDAPGFLLTTVGPTVEEITASLRGLVADYLAHEGKEAAEWQGILIDDITLYAIVHDGIDMNL